MRRHTQRVSSWEDRCRHLRQLPMDTSLKQARTSRPLPSILLCTHIAQQSLELLVSAGSQQEVLTESASLVVKYSKTMSFEDVIGCCNIT